MYLLIYFSSFFFFFVPQQELKPSRGHCTHKFCARVPVLFCSFLLLFLFSLFNSTLELEQSIYINGLSWLYFCCCHTSTMNIILYVRFLRDSASQQLRTNTGCRFTTNACPQEYV